MKNLLICFCSSLLVGCASIEYQRMHSSNSKAFAYCSGTFGEKEFEVKVYKVNQNGVQVLEGHNYKDFEDKKNGWHLKYYSQVIAKKEQVCNSSFIANYNLVQFEAKSSVSKECKSNLGFHDHFKLNLLINGKWEEAEFHCQLTGKEK